MAIRISMGQYVPGDSPIHRLDPRVKAVGTLLAMVAAIVASEPAQLACCAAAVALLVGLCRVPPRRILASVSSILAFLAVIALLNVFFVRGGAVLLSLGPVVVTEGGLWGALLYAGRFALLVLVGAVLMLTTTPTQLTDAFESLLSPLARLGAPVHDLAMVMSLALRFVPTLGEEAQQVLEAQAARGASFESGGPAARLRAALSVVVPLFAAALRHADAVALALDARCYEGGASRSHFHEMRMRGADVAYLVAWFALLAALVALGLVA